MTTFIKHIAVGGWSSGRCGGEMGSPDSNLEQGYFVVFLGKVIFFRSARYPIQLEVTVL